MSTPRCKWVSLCEMLRCRPVQLSEISRAKREASGSQRGREQMGRKLRRGRQSEMKKARQREWSGEVQSGDVTATSRRGLQSCLADQSGIRARSGQSQMLSFTHIPNGKQLSPSSVYYLRKQCFSSQQQDLLYVTECCHVSSEFGVLRGRFDRP